MPELPAEIVFQILRHLNKDKPSLKNASRISSAFRVPAQRLLFVNIVLKYSKRTPGGSVGESLLNLFDASPAIPTYVRGITIDGDLDPEEDRALTGDESWLSSDEKVAGALNRLSLDKIQQFTFTRMLYSHWDRFAPSLREVIMTICRSQSLVSLSLTKAPFDLVDFCPPFLKHLELIDPDCRINTSSGSDIRTSSIQLESVRLSCLLRSEYIVKALLDDKFNKFDLKGTKKLYMKARSLSNHKYIKNFGEVSGSSVERLVFEPASAYFQDAYMADHFIDLSKFIKLRRLGIRCSFHEQSAREDPLIWLINSLDTFPPSDNALEIIHLHVNHDLRIGALSDEFSQWLAGQPWKRFDRLVTDRQRFPRFRRLDLDLCDLETEAMWDVSRTRQTVESKALLLKSRGMLNITIGKPEGWDQTFEPFGEDEIVLDV